MNDEVCICDYEDSFFDALKVLDVCFKTFGVDYWLDAGSLIGAIREGSYIVGMKILIFLLILLMLIL